MNCGWNIYSLLLRPSQHIILLSHILKTSQELHMQMQSLTLNVMIQVTQFVRNSQPEVEFVHAVTAGASVKFLPAV